MYTRVRVKGGPVVIIDFKGETKISTLSITMRNMGAKMPLVTSKYSDCDTWYSTVKYERTYFLCNHIINACPEWSFRKNFKSTIHLKHF